MVLEYCSGAELYDYLIKNGRLSNEKAQRIFAQLVGAVAYVHQKNCVHRDLKLENIMLDKHGNVKLCDFGFTREYERLKLLQTFCGTVCYSAPEMVKGEKYLGQGMPLKSQLKQSPLVLMKTIAVDVWSLGVILYALLCGELPFDEDDETATKMKILNEEPRYPDHLSEDAVSLIKSLLSKRPISRPTLLEILTHPYISAYGNQQRNILAMQPPPPFIRESVLAQKCDSLAGWWNLLIEKEIRKEKRRQKRKSESRRVSGASMLAAAAAAELLQPPSEAAEAAWVNAKLSTTSLNGSGSAKAPIVPAGPTQAQPANAKDRNPYNKLQRNPSNQSQLQIMSSPDLYSPNREGNYAASTRRPHQRKIQFLTTLAALKHWLLESARRAASPATTKNQPRLANGNASQSNVNQSRNLHSSHQSSSVRSRAGNVLEMLRENDRQRDARTTRGRETVRQSSTSAAPPNMNMIQKKRQSLSPQPLTPHSSRRMSGRGLGGRKSTSSSLSSVRSFHKSHSKASSIASSSSVNSVQLTSPRSPRASGVKVVATTPRTNSFPSNVRLVRQGTGVDAFNETAVFNNQGVAFAKRKKTPFKGPMLNLGSSARNSSPSVSHGRRRHSASKRASTSSTGAQAEAIQEEDEDDGVEEVAEFSPVIGEHEEVVFMKEEGSDIGNADGTPDDERDNVSLNRVRTERSDVPDAEPEEPRGRTMEKEPVS
ncbi:hypothetical protein ABW19_dt0208178 [Dactylella cylindrospora]|nr:hypothetical protein ABW19_dt0208178 [Dactylella cylindrospora]